MNPHKLVLATILCLSPLLAQVKSITRETFGKEPAVALGNAFALAFFVGGADLERINSFIRAESVRVPVVLISAVPQMPDEREAAYLERVNSMLQGTPIASLPAYTIYGVYQGRKVYMSRPEEIFPELEAVNANELARHGKLPWYGLGLVFFNRNRTPVAALNLAGYVPPGDLRSITEVLQNTAPPQRITMSGAAIMGRPGWRPTFGLVTSEGNVAWIVDVFGSQSNLEPLAALTEGMASAARVHRTLTPAALSQPEQPEYVQLRECQVGTSENSLQAAQRCVSRITVTGTLDGSYLQPTLPAKVSAPKNGK